MARRAPRAKPATEADRGFTSLAPGPRVEAEGDETFARLGEYLRRAALGLAAMLFVARAYFPSEDAESGSGLVWVLLMLATSAIAVASYLFAGTFRVRRSWADAAVLALMVLVASSASHAADRRPAITMAWEWGSLGLLYFLIRNLPRSRGESAALLGAVVATAVALAAYGLYQIPVEFAQLRDTFTRSPERVLLRLGIEPGSPSAEALKKRLMDSNEPFSTFALANSLAGFLVGPMALMFAVALENLKREGRGSRLVAFAMATLPALIVLTCLVLTKSRSAYVGLFVALLVLAWRARRGVSARALALSGIGLAAVLGVLIVGGLATKQLDPEVITQSSKSLRFRREYWVATWGVITDAPSPYASTGLSALPGGPDEEVDTGSPRTFWWGVGPGNFATPYLRHKLPEASEEIQDPHNMVLEVWATAGVLAMLALLAALGIGLREMLGPAREAVPDGLDESPGRSKVDQAARSRSGWLVLMAGLGWLAVWALGKLNPMVQGDLFARWLILGLAWASAVVLGAPLWGRRPIPAAGLGVAVLALSINLLAAGGIGIPSVAMSLWVLLAIGLNLREDRPCGRLRQAGGLGPAVVLACVWAGLAGTFYGAVMPFWKSEAERAVGDAAMAARPPAFEVARKAYMQAIEDDHYNIRPWISLADLEYAHWRSPEMANRKEPRWEKALLALDGALDPKWRSPNNLALRRRYAAYARAILREMPADAKPFELLSLKTKIVRTYRRASAIYPTNATLRAELAQASAEIGMYNDAVREGNQALLLDGLTPHLDKKLSDGLRAQLKAQIPTWEEKAKEPPPAPPPARSAAPAPKGQGRP
jgi:O-antigen ligase/tetratricopeptide (TPR) repeat protein